MTERRETAIGIAQLKRRRMLTGCCGLALAAPFAARGDEAEDAAAAPRENDALVFVYGDRAGQPIAPADVVAGAKQIIAFPMDPATQHRFLNGLDDVGITLTHAADIDTYEARRPAWLK